MGVGGWGLGVAVLARPEGGSIQNSRTPYCTTQKECNNKIMTLLRVGKEKRRVRGGKKRKKKKKLSPPGFKPRTLCPTER